MRSGKTNYAFLMLLVLLGAGLFFAYKSGMLSAVQQKVPVPSETPVSNVMGKSATLLLNAYEIEGSSKVKKTDVNVSVWKDGVELENYATFDISDTISSGLAVGDKITVVEIDGSYYGNPVTKTIGSESDVMEYDVSAMASESNMQVTVYDDTGTTELNAASDSDLADYNITLGAGEEKVVYAKIYNGDSDSLIRIKAIAVGAGNDIDEVTVEDPNWVKVAIPKHIEDTTLTINGTSTSFDYDAVYVYKPGTTETIDLHEYESFKLKLKIKADASNDPAFTTTVSNMDIAFFEFKDADWYYTKSGSYAFGIADDSDSEADVGIDETDNSPLGKEMGAIIQAI